MNETIVKEWDDGFLKTKERQNEELEKKEMFPQGRVDSITGMQVDRQVCLLGLGSSWNES